jgi:replicative DNA helicase
MGRRETAEESMRVFKQLAIGAGCHVLVVTHLNRNRSSQTAYVPMPSLNDIRESGMISNRAHNVLFVWREQERDTGDPEDEGVIRLAKARAGRLGGVPVRFDGDRQRFLLDHAPELRRAA